MTNFVNESPLSATVDRNATGDGLSVLHVEGTLRAPVRRDLRRRVQALLAAGRRSILLDLARLSDLDAAGLGELVRVYNLAEAADGALWIDNASVRARKLLDVAGLFGLLAEPSVFAYEQCS